MTFDDLQQIVRSSPPKYGSKRKIHMSKADFDEFMSCEYMQNWIEYSIDCESGLIPAKVKVLRCEITHDL